MGSWMTLVEEGRREAGGGCSDPGEQEGRQGSRIPGATLQKGASGSEAGMRRSPLCANMKHVVPFKKDGFRKLQYYYYYY